MSLNETTERLPMNWPNFRRPKDNNIDPQIAAVLLEMETVGVSHESYPKLLAHLKQLEEMKAKAKRSPVSSDTIALVAGNLLGILIIVAYEQKHVLSSKAFTERMSLKAPSSSEKYQK